MELKDFVAATLTQICQGVKNAQQSAPGNAVIAPITNKEGFASEYSKAQERPLIVHFDVELNVAKSSDTASGRGSFDISVASVRIAMQGGSPASNSEAQKSCTRVSFDVPILFPDGEYVLHRRAGTRGNEHQASEKTASAEEGGELLR